MILCGGGQLPDAGQLIVAGVVGRRVAVVQPSHCGKHGVHQDADDRRPSAGIWRSRHSLDECVEQLIGYDDRGIIWATECGNCVDGNRLIDFLGIGRRIVQAELRRKCGSLLSPAVQAAM